jgi:hypothetical protein
MTVPWRRAATIVVLLCAFSGVACADASTAAVPRPTPRLFLTQNYGIVARLPTGLTYCPLPADWVGSDHGSIMYLVPPSACPEIGEMAKVPSIVIYYVFNTADRPNADRPPFTATSSPRISAAAPTCPYRPGWCCSAAPVSAAAMTTRAGWRLSYWRCSTPSGRGLTRLRGLS